jgi:hypothetical protein
LQDVNVNGMGGGLFDMDPTGNAANIQDATYKLLSPQRQLERNSEIQRLKNQGLTEDSPAFQRAIQRLDQGDTDAQLKALLAGTTEYGNIFNRGVDKSKLNFGQNLDTQKLATELRSNQFGEQKDMANFNDDQRGRQLTERSTLRSQPLNDLAALMKTPGFNAPEFGKFVEAGDPGGTDFLTSGANAYNAGINNWNAIEAGRGNTTDAITDILGSVLGAPKGTVGNDLMDWIKKAIGGNG